MDDLAQVFAEEPFFSGFSDAQLRRLAGLARPEVYQNGRYLIRQNGSADRFMLITTGHVVLKAFVPQRGMVPLETLGPGDPLGWSWLAPPYKWHYDGRALERTEVIAFEAEGLRQAMEQDHELGYRLQKRMIEVIAHRLQAARLQSLDLYGNPAGDLP
ncbi:cyclic nucleotide-binding domain-containing protein [Ectothiorhodospiraceae bacterium WFHF3C12]|nr:cyclic nucleotide-binding domain-containing protein [Ectothiorhodospiraceae bacterium WFHF3C12]